MKTTLKIALMALAVLPMVGCMEVHETAQSATGAVVTGHAGGAYEPRNTTNYVLGATEPFVLMDKGTQHSVTCSGVQKKVNADGRLEVVANVRNREGRRIQVQINCVFKDEQGFSTGDETPWENLILTENSQEAVRFVAMNDKAKNFTIRVREAR